jgi:hypothetical protein
MDQHNLQNQQLNQIHQLNASAEINEPAHTKQAHNNDKKVLSSTSEEIHREEAKKNSYIADLDDALQYQEIME